MKKDEVGEVLLTFACVYYCVYQYLVVLSAF